MGAETDISRYQVVALRSLLYFCRFRGIKMATTRNTWVIVRMLNTSARCRNVSMKDPMPVAPIHKWSQSERFMRFKEKQKILSANDGKLVWQKTPSDMTQYRLMMTLSVAACSFLPWLYWNWLFPAAISSADCFKLGNKTFRTNKENVYKNTSVH